MAAAASWSLCLREGDLPNAIHDCSDEERQMRLFSLLISLALYICAPASASSPAENKVIARQFFEEVLDKGRFDKYAQSHAPNFVAHGGDADATLEQDIAAAKEERQALPDMTVAVLQIVAEHDLVAVYWTAKGTNTHPGMGLPATGKRIKTNGMTLFRFKSGKIAEEWSVWDMYAVLRQAGMIPAPQPSANPN
jgi:steroid delta-isomerase-like uncharacterized protein